MNGRERRGREDGSTSDVKERNEERCEGERERKTREGKDARTFVGENVKGEVRMVGCEGEEEGHEGERGGKGIVQIGREGMVKGMKSLARDCS